MSAAIRFIPSEDRLDISFEGNLDVTVWQAVCDACGRTSPRVESCIVDLTRVGRVFDSGIAILGLLYRRMRDLGTTVIFLCDDLNTKERVEAIASPLWYRPSLVAKSSS